MLLSCFFTIFSFYHNQIAGVFNVTLLSAYQNQKGINSVVVKNTRGPDVKLVQEFLSYMDPNFDKNNITGYFGPITETFISDFQKENNLTVTGFVDVKTKEFINNLFLNDLCPSKTEDKIINSTLFNVNKNQKIITDYIPPGLIIFPDSIKTNKIVCLRADVIPYLEKMVQDAKQEGFEIRVTSGFRRENLQEYIYSIWESVMGESVNEEVAKPGHSEHQLGTTIDITGKSNNFEQVDLKFENTSEFKWLVRNAYKYGFVMSYPKGKETVTGYNYEPWHWRFVGVEHARNIFRENITVYEYLKRFNYRRTF